MKIELPRLSGVETEGGDLLQTLKTASAEGLCFKNQVISGELLEDVELRGCVLRSCRILGGRLTRFSAWDCSFVSCDFSSCVLEDAYFQRVEFLGCKLNGTKSISAVLKDVYLEDCNCRQWNLAAGTLKTVAFNRCDCSAAIFSQWKWKNLFITIAFAPTHSHVRAIAPKLRTSVIPSRTTTKGSSPSSYN